MNNKGLGSKLLMAVVTVLVLAYFGLQGVRYFADPLGTVMAYSYQVEEGRELSGYVIRNERILQDDTNGLLQLSRDEGERVSKGGTIASVYADQSSLDRQSEIQAMELRVEQLEYAKEASVGADASVKLDAQILRSMRAVRGSLEEDRLDVVEDLSGELRALVLKRDYDPEDAVDLDQQLQAAQQELKAMKAQSAKSTRRITAPESGLYSAVVDGYEDLLKPDTITTMSPSQLAALRPDPNAASQVGKLILGDAWYFAAPMTAENAAALQEKVEDGDRLYLRFEKNIEQKLPVTLTSVGAEENGRCLVIFRGRTHLAQLTLLRQQSARVVSSSLSGIRVPKEALHATETYLDRETGEQVTEKQTGVYCVVGKEAWFKPVEVLYNGDGFLLVRPSAEKEENILRPGDQIIVAAKGLYDGKVVA